MPPGCGPGRGDARHGRRAVVRHHASVLVLRMVAWPDVWAVTALNRPRAVAWRRMGIAALRRAYQHLEYTHVMGLSPCLTLPAYVSLIWGVVRELRVSSFRSEAQCARANTGATASAMPSSGHAGKPPPVPIRWGGGRPWVCSCVRIGVLLCVWAKRLAHCFCSL